MHISKSLQGSKSAITMHPVSIESTLLLFPLIKNFLAITKLFLANSFWKVFLIGENFRNLYTKYSFDELLIFFWLNAVDISCSKFDFWLHRELLYVTTYSKGNKRWNKSKEKTFSLVLTILTGKNYVLLNSI